VTFWRKNIGKKAHIKCWWNWHVDAQRIASRVKCIRSRQSSEPLIHLANKKMSGVLRDEGSISPTWIRAAFTCKYPKSSKRQASHQCLLELLGYRHVKAACKTLVKTATKSVNFNNILTLSVVVQAVILLRSSDPQQDYAQLYQ